jgi:predicted DsbA family dithiol-disulfide isomerase
MAKLHIDVWSDIACPWCYVGKRRLEAALAQFPHRDDVAIVWRAFELDPSAPRIREGGGSYAARIAKKYGTKVADAEARIRQMTDLAAADGLDFRFDRIQPGNTFDAHRLLHLAHERGMQDAVKERFLHAYLTEGAAIGDPDTLSRLAREAGLEADDVTAVLTTDAYAREVRADEEEAHTLGISGVPFFVVGGRHALSGAQPAGLFRRALDQAWSEANPAGEAAFAEGAACGPDGC